MAVIRMRLVGSSDPASYLIRRWTYGHWASHVDAVLPDGSMLGAHFAGVQIKPAGYDASYRRREQVVEIDVSTLDATAFYDFLQKQVGKPYDFVGMIGTFIARREWDKQDKWWCSELQAAAMMHIGLVNPLCTEADKISPRDLLLMIAGVQQNRVRLFERIGHGAAYLKTLTIAGD